MNSTPSKLRIKNRIKAGEESYHNWRKHVLADPEVKAIYQKEAAKKELWLRLAEARQDTQTKSV